MLLGRWIDDEQGIIENKTTVFSELEERRMANNPENSASYMYEYYWSHSEWPQVGVSLSSAVSEYFNGGAHRLAHAARGFGSLALWGKEEGRAGEPYTPVLGLMNMAGPRPLDTIDPSTGTVVDGVNHRRWTDVRAIPALEAPNAAAFVNGTGIREAFDQLVLQHPDFEILAAAASKESPIFSTLILFRKLNGVSNKIVSTWTSSETTDFFHSKYDSLSETESGKLAVYNAGVKLNYIKNSFFYLLSAGRILAEGERYPDYAGYQAIDARIWSRAYMRLDLSTGDLVNARSGTIEWRDVFLKAPTRPSGAGSPQEQLHPVAQAIRETWPGGLPSGIDYKSLRAKLAPYRDKLGKGESWPSDSALKSAMSELGKTGYSTNRRKRA